MRDDEILLGQLVSGQQLQAGIALAVAQGVWHWSGVGTANERKIWMVDDIIEVLRGGTKILISDPDKLLSLGGIHVGMTTKIWVERADYVQAVLLLGAQAVDILRQIRRPE